MITVENLTKSFKSQRGPVVALDDVTLDIPTGKIAGVVGTAGSGKSTLAKLVGLQDRPDSGVIRLDGQNTAVLDPRSLRVAKGLIGSVPQGDSLVAQRTAAGNIAIPLEQAGLDGPKRRDRVGKLLDLIGLTDKAAVYPDALTPGQRRRVAVARALVGEPAVLLADDPTAELDQDGAASVLAVLDRARNELGATVLLATQDAGVVRRVADDVAVLDQGRIVESGQLLQLVRDPDSRVAQAVLPDLAQVGSGTGHDRLAEAVLIGYAAVGALLPEASSRFDVDISVVGGGITRIGEIPVARFLLGVSGQQAGGALNWIGERGGFTRTTQPGRRPVAV